MDVVISSPQYGEKRGFFSHFSVDGLYGWRVLSVIPLEFLRNKASIISYGTVFSHSCVIGNG